MQWDKTNEHVLDESLPLIDLDIEESKCEQVVGEKDNLLSESKSFKLQILKEGRPQKAHKI